MAYRLIEKTLVNGKVFYEVQKDRMDWPSGNVIWDTVYTGADIDYARKIKQEFQGQEVNSIKEIE